MASTLDHTLNIVVSAVSSRNIVLLDATARRSAQALANHWGRGQVVRACVRATLGTLAQFARELGLENGKRPAGVDVGEHDESADAHRVNLVHVVREVDQVGFVYYRSVARTPAHLDVRLLGTEDERLSKVRIEKQLSRSFCEHNARTASP
jgi:hypothetical protein